MLFIVLLGLKYVLEVPSLIITVGLKKPTVLVTKLFELLVYYLSFYV